MNTNTALSPFTAQVYEIVKSKKSLWGYEITRLLFPAPVYSKENATEYWQHEANLYGFSIDKPVNGEIVTFTPAVAIGYDTQVSRATIELSKAGLIKEHNNGTNEYWFSL